MLPPPTPTVTRPSLSSHLAPDLAPVGPIMHLGQLQQQQGGANWALGRYPELTSLGLRLIRWRPLVEAGESTCWLISTNRPDVDAFKSF